MGWLQRVRRQVCRRIGRRLGELGLPDVDAYCAYPECAPDEWRHLDSLCHITISRFYRDRALFEYLERNVLPKLARRSAERGDAVRAWSVGCASGEEPYSLVLAWESSVASSVPGAALHVRATDADETMVERTRQAVYERSSLRDLPES